ncbi:MAG: KilA-N domain-containing protein [Chitinophagales bacterium]
MSNLHIFTYNNHQITFDFRTEQKMVNATEMAKPFGKRPSKFLEIAEVKEYIKNLEQKSDVRQAVITIRGKFKDGRPQGTWMHKILALRFAQWLDVCFAIWVDERIEELLKHGYTQISGLWVYFFQSTASKIVKIGQTHNLQRRQNTIENSHGYPIKLLKAIRVPDESHEKAIHKQFKHIRLKGEWFKLTPKLQQFIEDLPNHLDPEEQTLRSENSELTLKNIDLQQQVDILQDFRKMVVSQIQQLKTQHQFDQNSLQESQNYNQLLQDLLQLDISKWMNEPLSTTKVMRNLRTEVHGYQRQLALAWLHIVEKDHLLEAIEASHQSILSELSSKNRKNFTHLSLLIHKQLKGEQGWQAFAKYFEACYPKLLDRLQVRFPSLNENDLKFCSYTLMGLTHEDISFLMDFGVGSAALKGARLREKLGIKNKKIDIGEFLKGM